MNLSTESPPPARPNRDQIDAQALLDLASRRLSGPERFELEDIVSAGHDTGNTLDRLRIEFAAYLR